MLQIYLKYITIFPQQKNNYKAMLKCEIFVFNGEDWSWKWDAVNKKKQTLSIHFLKLAEQLLFVCFFCLFVLRIACL